MFERKKSRNKVKSFRRAGKVVKSFYRTNFRRKAKKENIKKLAGVLAVGLAGAALAKKGKFPRSKPNNTSKGGVNLRKVGLVPTHITGKVNPKEFTFKASKINFSTSGTGQVQDFSSKRGKSVLETFEKAGNRDMNLIANALEARPNKGNSSTASLAVKEGLINNKQTHFEEDFTLSIFKDNEVPKVFAKFAGFKNDLDLMGRSLHHTMSFEFDKGINIQNLVEDPSWFKRDFLPKYKSQYFPAKKKIESLTTPDKVIPDFMNLEDFKVKNSQYTKN